MGLMLITGGTGYLGAELVGRALAAGWDVAATYRSAAPGRPEARWLPLDVRDPAAAERLVTELRPDAVVHTAYVQGGPDLEAVTREGAAAVARGAAACGARLIHLSSDVVFDGERQGAYREGDPTSPVSDYGRAKADAERLVAAAHPRALIVRTSLIYGGAEPSKHEQLAIDAADGRAEIAFFTDELRCPVQVGDLAAAIVELAAGDAAGVLHVAGADMVSRYEFACLVAAAAGRPTAGLRSALSADSPVRRPRNCALDTTLARSLLRARVRGAREVLAGA